MSLLRWASRIRRSGVQEIRKARRMEKKSLMFIAAFISVFCIAGCIGQESEVQFARRALYGLCKGDKKIESSIAWDRLQAMGIDVGQAYSKLISAKEKADYRKAFFYNLSYAFKASKGRLSDFTNWQVQDRQADTATVVVDTSSGNVLLMVLSNTGGRMRLIAIGWRR